MVSSTNKYVNTQQEQHSRGGSSGSEFPISQKDGHILNILQLIWREKKVSMTSLRGYTFRNIKCDWNPLSWKGYFFLLFWYSLWQYSSFYEQSSTFFSFIIRRGKMKDMVTTWQMFWYIQRIYKLILGPSS